MRLEELKAAGGKLALCWVGNAGWLMNAGELLVGIDLDLQPGEHRLGDPVISAESVARKLNVHFVTHGHGDHFNVHTCRILAERSDCLFVLPASCTQKGEETGIPDSRIRTAGPREPFELPGIHVEPLRAIHGHRGFSIYQEANLEDCGYLIGMAGRRMFHPGDSVLLADHLQLADVDVLFVSPTEHNTHVARSADLIAALKPTHVFPQHFGTYRQTEQNAFWTRGYPDELRAALSEGMRSRYHKLEPGAVFVVD